MVPVDTFLSLPGSFPAVAAFAALAVVGLWRML
jgi:hypothetical protein